VSCWSLRFMLQLQLILQLQSGQFTQNGGTSSGIPTNASSAKASS
jgi:hypothetical protein